jgi:integrase
VSVYRRILKSGRRSRWFTAEFVYRGKTHREGGFPDRASAEQWVLTEKLKLRRHAKGYVKPMHSARVAPLIGEYVAYLRERGRDAMYCYTMEKRLTAMAGDCGWVTLGDLTHDSLVAWLHAEQTIRAGANRGKAMGNRTKNQYLDGAMEFGKWLAKPAVAKLASNPFAGMDKLPAKHNEDYRRAATVEELNKLLATCSAERRLYYLFRIYTPLRGKTIGQLTWRMMHLDANPPYLETPGEINKSRKPEKHAIRFEVAAELRMERKRVRAKSDEPVFAAAPDLSQFRDDLAAAGVSPHLGNERTGRLDYHALRASLVSIAKHAGLSEFQVMDLLGHKDFRTTARYYSKASIPEDKGRAMAKLPTLGTVRRAE